LTYAEFETAGETGNPLELYLFELSGVFYSYNNGEDVWTFNAQDYDPVYVKRSAIRNEADKSEQTVEFNFDVLNEFAQLYIGVVPGERASIKVFQVHRTDTIDLEHKQIFSGLVSTVAFHKDGKEAKIIARPLSSAGDRPLPRRTFQGLCNHILFDQRCGLSEASFRETGTVTVASGRDLTVTGLTNVGGGADYWEAGYVKIGAERRLIVGQTANVFKINIEFRANPVGKTVTVVPGCKLRRKIDCSTKFNNVKNFGGFSWVPLKNPFTSGIN